MKNVIEEAAVAVGHGLAVAAKDVGKAFGIVEKTSVVVDELLKNEPEIKLVVKQVLSDGATLAADVAKCVGEKGLDLADDAELLERIKAYFLDDIQGELVPEIEKVYGELIEAADTPAAPVLVPVPEQVGVTDAATDTSTDEADELVDKATADLKSAT